MKQFILGAGSALLLAAGGVFWWSGSATVDNPIPARPAGAPITPYAADLPEPPVASEKTREQKRFSRYDKDRNGMVGRDEYLAARRKAFARLDTNGDGKLDFEEYAAKTVAKFVKADADRSNALNPVEFATTRVVRKSRPRPDCPPLPAPAHDDD